MDVLKLIKNSDHCQLKDGTIKCLCCNAEMSSFKKSMSLQSHLMVAVGFVRLHDKCKIEKQNKVALESHKCKPVEYFEGGIRYFKCSICNENLTI